jgi:hypothetical protein
VTESRYTHIVVGAGAAGCVVANRLSADPAARVLLLEAGGPDRSPLIHMPAGFTKLTSPSVNWGFSTVPQAQLDNREMHYPQGRTLGGSTSINAMIYIRGHRLDYDEWESLGNEGWGYDGVLPYFRRMENHERIVDEYHGSGGPMNVAEQVQHNALSKAFVRAGQEAGLTYNADFNGAVQDGIGFYDVTQRNVRRESAATAYLKPIRKRPNLTVVTNATASRVLVSGGRAVGLAYLHGDHEHIAHADGEVVLDPRLHPPLGQDRLPPRRLVQDGPRRHGRRRHPAPRPRARRPARDRRLGHADADQRQHPGPVRHDRREGRRHDARGTGDRGDAASTRRLARQRTTWRRPLASSASGRPSMLRRRGRVARRLIRWAGALSPGGRAWSQKVCPHDRLLSPASRIPPARGGRAVGCQRAEFGVRQISRPAGTRVCGCSGGRGRASLLDLDEPHGS